jgi:hypothetical protein
VPPVIVATVLPRDDVANTGRDLLIAARAPIHLHVVRRFDDARVPTRGRADDLRRRGVLARFGPVAQTLAAGAARAQIR